LRDQAECIARLEFAQTTTKLLKAIARNTTITEKILGLDVKGIDEDTPEVLSEEKGPRKPAGVPQVEYGTSRKPKKPQRIEQLNDSSKMMEASNPN